MKEHLFARLDTAVDRVREAVREAEEAGMQTLDWARRDLEMASYLKKSLALAPEDIQARLVERVVAHLESQEKRIRQDIQYHQQEAQRRQEMEMQARREVLEKWPEMAKFSITRFEWEWVPPDIDFVMAVVFETPWGDNLRACRKEPNGDWILQYYDGYWQKVKDLDAILLRQAITLAQRWKAEEEKRAMEEARRRAEEEERRAREAKRREEEARRKKWVRATAREWLQRDGQAHAVVQ